MPDFFAAFADFHALRQRLRQIFAAFSDYAMLFATIRRCQRALFRHCLPPPRR